MTMESDRAIVIVHTELWCDNDLHILPPPKDREDPGCHRLIWVGDLWLMIHRIGRLIVASDDQGRIIPLDVLREWVDVAVAQLAFIPRQRLA